MKKILLIEDNEDVRENTADIIELANYEVATAENGKIGVEKAIKMVPDLIICDIMMPEMDGYEVITSLGKNSKTASIPFIFLTAKTGKTDMRMGMNMGADDYLTKPYEEKELLDAISSRLKKHDFLKKEIAKSMEGINVLLKEASQYMDLESLSKDQSLKSFKKKDIVFWEGDGAHSLYFIESGTVKTFKSTEAGKEFVTGIHNAGDFLGQLSLVNNKGAYCETATILEDAEIFEIPKNDFTKLLYENHMVSQKFIEMISNNLIHLQEQLVDMAFVSVRQRAAKTLLKLFDKGIVNDSAHSGIGIPREDFAGMIGTATETAIRTLSDFKDEGLITTDHGRKIIVLNRDALNQIANFG
ncbi:CRP-like cAMP-binding protein [Saonia flava]|uniref:CRP-like cAMP-binding protein n=1 Tax=Saonia flava TaxID=523696 RepID=A0A846QUZ4_9FLAO|nr:response regulator [Saonia flava]NJB70382.1 CRP-like cAMP-binding protein [Saonia flava]